MPEKEGAPESLKEALVKTALQQWPYLVGLVLVALVSQLINLGLPYIAKLQLDVLASESLTVNPLGVLTLLIAISLLLSLVDTLTGWARQIWDSKSSQRMGIAFNKLVFARLRNFDASLLNGKRSWFIVRSASSGVKLIWSINSIVSSLLGVILGVVVIVPVISAVDYRLLGVIMIATLLQLFLVTKGIYLEQEGGAERDVVNNRAYIHEGALEGSNYLQLVLMNADKKVIERYHQYSNKSHRLDLALDQKRNILDTAQWAVRYGTYAIIAWLVGRDILLGLYSIGTFTLLTSYSEQLQRSLVEVLDLVQSAAELRLNIAKYGYIFSLESCLESGEGTVSLNTALPSKETVIKLENVSFTYPDMAKHEREYLKRLYGQANKMRHSIFGPRWYWATDDVKKMWQEIKHRRKNQEIIHNINVDITGGSVVAMVGPNGAGKTTLTRLLTRSYDPSKGQIVLDNKPYPELKLESLHQHISVLTQEPFLVEGYSVRDNLKLGAETVSDQKIWIVLRKLGLDKQIKELPRGLNTEIGRDADLSGGQSQLLAAARVILQDRPIIIFDEATSQLDAMHELRFLKQITSLKKKSTIIIITHRLTTARHADKILVIDKGRVVQEGVHQDLKKQPGLYRQFWQAQVED